MATKKSAEPIVTSVSSSTSAVTTIVSVSTANTPMVSFGSVLFGPLTHTPTARQPDADIEAAVYGHIRAIRALGRLAIDTEEIANALSLPVAAVNSVLAKLRDKGVKIAR